MRIDKLSLYNSSINILALLEPFDNEIVQSGPVIDLSTNLIIGWRKSFFHEDILCF